MTHASNLRSGPLPATKAAMTLALESCLLAWNLSTHHLSNAKASVTNQATTPKLAWKLIRYAWNYKDAAAIKFQAWSALYFLFPSSTIRNHEIFLTPHFQWGLKLPRLAHRQMWTTPSNNLVASNPASASAKISDKANLTKWRKEQSSVLVHEWKERIQEVESSRVTETWRHILNAMNKVGRL